MELTELVIAIALYAANITLSLYLSRIDIKSRYLRLVLLTPLLAFAFLTGKEEITLADYGNYWMLTGIVIFILIMIKFSINYLENLPHNQSFDNKSNKIKKERD